MDGPDEILLTNDDGIDSTGLRAVYDALSEVADVTVVAPEHDHSATGRVLSTEVAVREHPMGYVVEGTPVDCVVGAVEALSVDPDLVVAGCNRGANLGGYVLGRSGTVGAAVEGALLGLPAIAVSLYVPGGDLTFEEVTVERESYREAVRAVRLLAESALDAGVFVHADYLNVNAPIPGDGPAPIRITRPSPEYHVEATRNEGRISMRDPIWDRMANGEVDEPPGTDRGAVLGGAVSVSPLSVPHSVVDCDPLEGIAAEYDERRS